jgi:translation initiation factor IF-1
MDNKIKGQVIEALPSLRFRVEFPDGKIMIAYLGGRLHKNFIRILVGDKVEVVVPETGNIGRIVKRL